MQSLLKEKRKETAKVIKELLEKEVPKQEVPSESEKTQVVESVAPPQAASKIPSQPIRPSNYPRSQLSSHTMMKKSKHVSSTNKDLRSTGSVERYLSNLFRSSVEIITVTFILLGALFFGIEKYLQSKKPFHLSLKTEPSHVRIDLDGKELFGGHYMESPVTLKGLSPGIHSLKVHRDGYKSKTLKFKANPGRTLEKNDLMLSPLGKSVPVKVHLNSRKYSSVKVVVNDGAVSYTHLTLPTICSV